MIAPLRNAERLRFKRKKRDIQSTFYVKEGPDPPADGFGILAAFDEIRLSPGKGSSPQPLEEAEVVTYVYKGALAQEDSLGGSGVIHAGEFQRMTVGRGIRHKETNVSRTDWAHIFRISLRPSEAGLGCSHEQKRFAAAERHNLLCVVASQDGRKGSLRIRQDAVIYSSVLDPGHHLIHELLSGRSAWLHIICGEAALQDIILTKGDSVGVTSKPSVSLTAQENTEILLVDLGPRPK
jgi:redox-sensitive bicupin YhaK (pirin superfamily)